MYCKLCWTGNLTYTLTTVSTRTVHLVKESNNVRCNTVQNGSDVARNEGRRGEEEVVMGGSGAATQKVK